MGDMPGVVGVIGTVVAIYVGGVFSLQVRIGEFRRFRESLREKQFELEKC